MKISVRLQSAPLDLSLAASLPSSHGAQVIFLGVVRDLNRGRPVVSVSYDAFEPLAERALTQIAEEASAGEVDVFVAHRTGLVPVGQASVLVVTSSPHRAEAYRASRHVIEEIKKRVPIWKQETYLDGESEWLAGHSLCGHETPPELSP